jgi:TRAP-type uncharacterized transport system substrate-binding protein
MPSIEPLPSGANFRRAKTIWEIALDIAGNPDEPYYGNRDVRISVGSGSAQTFRSWLSFSTGSPILAHAVARGEVDFAFVNPSGALTQAYRGTGLFAGSDPLPLRVVFSYPSWDRFLIALHPRTGLRSLEDVKEHRYPLRISIREDPTHSTRVLIDQLLPMYGFTLDDMLSWGGTLQLNGPPMDRRRLNAIREGTVDIVFDEGINGWAEVALANGMQLVTLEDAVFSQMEAIGWRRVVLPRGYSQYLAADHDCIDYSGWPLYTRESLSDDDAYRVCASLSARVQYMPWENPLESAVSLGLDAEPTPLDVPLHPGAARWYREHGVDVPA